MNKEFVKKLGVRPELLCRARSEDTHEFIIGFYTNMGGDREYILDAGSDAEPPIRRLHRVTPGTVSRCTGLTDRNGVYVFEHDVLKIEISWMQDEGGIVYSTAVYWRGEWMLYENCVAIDTCADLWSCADEVEVTCAINFIEVEDE